MGAEATITGPMRRRTSWSLKTIVEDVAGRPIGELQDPERPVHPYLKGRDLGIRSEPARPPDRWSRHTIRSIISIRRWSDQPGGNSTGPITRTTPRRSTDTDRSRGTSRAHPTDRNGSTSITCCCTWTV